MFELGKTSGTNLGNYKPSVLYGNVFNLDRITYQRFLDHIDVVTTQLYLNLSRGNRFPAIFSDNLYWNGASFTVGSKIDFFDCTTTTSGNFLESVRINLDSNISSKTEVAPLVFVSASDPRINVFVSNIVFDETSSYVDIGLNTLEDGTVSSLETNNSYLSKFYFTIIFLLQSELENLDKDFYIVSSPFLDSVSFGVTFASIVLSGNSFCYIDQTDLVECPTKAQVRVKAYNPDSSLFIGDFVYGPLSTTYSTYVSADVSGLTADTIYGVWYFLDSSLGPNTDTFIYAGLAQTSNTGGRIPVENPME